METAPHVIDGLGGVTKVAKRLEAPIGTVSAWRTRNSIPVEYWPKLLALAHELEVSLTYETLVQIHTATPERAAE